LNDTFDLFAALDATDEQLDFPMLYASGRQGWAVVKLDDERVDLSPMFDLVLRHVAAPVLDKDAPFAMVASILDYDNFLGRVLTGRIEQGTARLNMPLKVLRLSLAFLAAVSKHPACGDSLAEICESHVPETVAALLAQEPRIADAEMLDDLQYFKEAARSGRRKLSSFERYERNLAARKFEWTVVHTSDFWKENAGAFEADGFKLIGRIRDLLKDNADGGVDETTQAVALFDLGEFAVQHPQGRT
jgi:hypothetical protein